MIIKTEIFIESENEEILAKYLEKFQTLVKSAIKNHKIITVMHNTEKFEPNE